MKPKTKPAIPVPEKISNQIMDAIIGKKEKPNGENYELTEPYKYVGQNQLPQGTKFKECNDGFFKIETPEGPIDHYRVKIQHIPSQILKPID